MNLSEDKKGSVNSKQVKFRRTTTFKIYIFLFQGHAVEAEFPDWAVGVSVFLMLFSLMVIPIVALLVKLDKFHLPGFKEELKLDVRRR